MIHLRENTNQENWVFGGNHLASTHVTVEAATYPVRAVTSTFTFMALMAPTKAQVKPAKIIYKCNWANCSN